MAEPIRNTRISNLSEAPTPQNTPATAASSFIQRAAHAKPSVPTISEDGDTSLANNLSLISMIQGKLGNLVGAPSGYIDSLPEAVKDRIRGLKAIQAEHAVLESQLEEEIVALEKKWHKKYEPLYQKRAKIISGEVEPTSDEIEKGKKIEEEDELDEEAPRLEEIAEEEDAEKDEAKEETKEKEAKEEDKDVKGIPDFWCTALKNLPALTDTLTERDEEALHFLTDIRMEYLEQPGFALIFEFSENPFFTNKILRKEYYYEDTPMFMGEYTFDHAEATTIDWKSPEQNLTIKIEKRKQRNKRTQQTRTVEKTSPEISFFNFFSPSKLESEEAEDDDEYQSGFEEVEMDYQTGEAIKNLIKMAIDWYTGKALEYEEDEEEDDYDDYEEDSEDDEDQDEEQDDSVIKPGGGASGGEQPECKQQ